MHEKRKLNRWKESPWTAGHAWMRRRPEAALALGSQSMRSRCRAPDVSREPPAVTAAAAPADPRTSRPRARGEGARAAAAERAGRCGSGLGREDSPAKRGGTGWGWETNAMRLRMRIPDASHQQHFRDRKTSGDLGKPLSPACMRAGRFISRCSSASLHSAAGPLRGHRPVEAPSALHHLIYRDSFKPRCHVNAPFSRVFRSPQR